uniref:Uncharacterized protein n=1 Tax=Knipowitschia caucasica TaxID=637954 RepID=A0AAV2MSI0_KNICA
MPDPAAACSCCRSCCCLSLLPAPAAACPCCLLLLLLLLHVPLLLFLPLRRLPGCTCLYGSALSDTLPITLPILQRR